MGGVQGNWGGHREGAGAKSKWKTEGGTKLVRIPMAIEDDILNAAYQIDRGVQLIPANLQHEPVTQSNQDEYVTQSNYDELVTQSSEQLSQREEQLTLLEQEKASLQQERDRLKKQSQLLEEINNDLIKQKAEWHDCLRERAELQEQVYQLKGELEAMQDQSKQQLDYEALRDRALAKLKLGRQAPEYKRAKKAMDLLIEELQG